LTIKEIEEQLKRVKKGNELIQRLQLKYQSLDNGLLSGSNQFTTRVSTSKTNNAENKLIETLELRDKILEQIQAIMDERFEVLNMINQLDDVVENLVLVMLYVNNLPMAQVCKELDFSKVQIYRIRKKAIENLAKVENANR
jgi:holliday junction DNA helicase motor protein